MKPKFKDVCFQSKKKKKKSELEKKKEKEIGVTLFILFLKNLQEKLSDT